MRLEQRELVNHNKIVQQYWDETTDIHQFFEYKYNDVAFVKRAKYLATQTYNYAELSDIIRTYMMPFHISDKSEQHLQQLKNGAYVVVGGQQAGLLTGPLYSVHKALSVILLAKEQSEKLQKDIVPLFWIAGEDHDIEEINHTYTTREASVEKKVYKKRSLEKKMASMTMLNKEEVTQFVKNVFKDFGETAHTKQLLQSVLAHVEGCETFTQFFTALMNDLFQQHGLLLLDAAFPAFRQFESKFFQQLINKSEEIAYSVVEEEQRFDALHFGRPLEATKENAHLFLVQNGERILLARDGQLFKNEAYKVQFTHAELHTIAEQNPEKLSNNVVTRPLMQEMTLPVLAFVGGPGELAYWALLKPAFKIMELQMPIFVLRQNFTIVKRSVQTLLAAEQLSVEDVINGTVERLKETYIQEIQDDVAKEQIQRMEEQLLESYAEIEQHVARQNLNLQQVIDKNKAYHRMQFEFLQHKIEQQTLLKHKVQIRHFDTLLAELLPNKQWQERLYNPYQYLNDYGMTLFDEVIAANPTISKHHNFIYL